MSGTLSSACAVWLRLPVGVSDCGPSQNVPEKPGGEVGCLDLDAEGPGADVGETELAERVRGRRRGGGAVAADQGETQVGKPVLAG